MSACIVSKEHIDALVAAGLQHSPSYDHLRWFAVDPHGGDFSYERDVRKLELTTADQVGAMLWAENVESVGEGRYPHIDAGELPGTYSQETIPGTTETIELPQWWAEYRYPVTRCKAPAIVAALKLIDCYEYQSCEHDGWHDSEALRFCEALRSQLIGQLPGYDSAPWSA